MSTRATYSFHDTPEDHTTTLYIHHDGYEEGAASYAYRVAQFTSPSKGGTAEKWLRALPGHTELTASHERHADTEYKYVFTQHGSRVKIASRTFGGSWRWLRDVETAEWINTTCQEARDAGPEGKAVYFHGEVRLAVHVWDRVTETCAQVLDQLRKGWIGNASGTLTTLTHIPEGVLSPTVADLLAKVRKAVDDAWTASRAGLPAPSLAWAEAPATASKAVAGNATVVHAVSLDGGPVVESTASTMPVVESAPPIQAPQSPASTVKDSLTVGASVVWTRGKRQGQTGTVRAIRPDGRLVIESGDKIHGDAHGITPDNVKAV